jgi:hypothetical protein
MHTAPTFNDGPRRHQIPATAKAPEHHSGGQTGTAAQSADIPPAPSTETAQSFAPADPENMAESMDDIILLKADVTKAHRRIKVCRKEITFNKFR